MSSVDKLLKDWDRDHRTIVEGLSRISKVRKAPFVSVRASPPIVRSGTTLLCACVCECPAVRVSRMHHSCLFFTFVVGVPTSIMPLRRYLQQQKLPRTEVVSKPLAPKPSGPISAPPTPPNRESYRETEEVPHIGSPLSAEGARWLKEHDPSIASACNSVKGASLPYACQMFPAYLPDAPLTVEGQAAAEILLPCHTYSLSFTCCAPGRLGFRSCSSESQGRCNMQMARYWKPGQLLRLSVPATGCTAQICRSMLSFWALILAPLTMMLHISSRYRASPLLSFRMHGMSRGRFP